MVVYDRCEVLTGGSEESKSRDTGIEPSRKKEGWDGVVFKSEVCAWL